MRFLHLIVIAIYISGCAIKPSYTFQSIEGVEVGLNRDTEKTFSLIDKNGNIYAKANSHDKRIIFNLPRNTSPAICYAIVDDEGNHLLGKNSGLKITSIYEFNKNERSLMDAQIKNKACIENEYSFLNQLRSAETQLYNNNLFNGKTCDLPPQRDLPPFPQTICGSYSQCQELANDSCMKNLVDAESCGVALSKTRIHSSITSVSCGALLSSLNGERYGISSGVQDAITGYLDEHTKDMIETGEYGKAIATGLVRLALTYFRVESCKEDFFEAAYAPIDNWVNEKEYIEKEPYIKQNACARLIGEYNAVYDNLTKSKLCIQETNKNIALLSDILKNAENFTLPEQCNFN